MGLITLENMEFHGYHGCLEHEKTLGNTFIVSVQLELDTLKAGKSDSLEDTLNYQEIYDTIKKEMEIPANLIEHLAQRMIDSLKSTFPIVKSFKLKLSKLNPPLGGKTEKVIIELES